MNIASQPGSYTEIKSSVRAGLTGYYREIHLPNFLFLGPGIGQYDPCQCKQDKSRHGN